MQSKMILGVLSTLFAMTLLFTLAVPRQVGTRTSTPDPATGAPQDASPAAAQPETPPAPELVDGVWCPTGYGVCMPAPDGWVATRRRSRAYLHRNVARPLDGNFSMIMLPNLYGKTLDELLEENRTELEANPQFELHEIALAEVAGRKRIRVDYTGTPRGGAPVRFSGLIWLAGSQQVVLTFTADAEQWDELGAVAERCMQELSSGPRPAAKASGDDGQTPAQDESPR